MNGPGALPARRIWRFGLLIGLLVAGALLLRFTPLGELWRAEAVGTALSTVREAAWGPALLVALYLVVSPLIVPILPLIFAGGLLYGPLYGALWNCLGVVAGTALTYGLGRGLGRDVVAHWLGPERIARVNGLLDRHAFWSLVRLRFVPIPAALVNYAAALAGVRPVVFLAASVLGLVPAVSILTWFAAELVAAAEGERAGVLIRLGLAFALVLLVTVAAPRLLPRRSR
ncbi:MAG: TVP38/TMEM64 family protein [Thermoanaerobaculia bacterium]